MIQKQFKIANISINDVGIVIDSTSASLSGKHYNVSIKQIDENLFEVIGEKPNIKLFSPYFGYGRDIKIEDLVEGQTYIERSWFGKETVKIRDGYVEFKTRNDMKYTTNKIVIIE